MTLARRTLFGLELINDDSFDATIDSMMQFSTQYDAAAGKYPLLFTPNVDDVVKLHEKRYAALAEVLKKSYYILPDGQPVIWASRWLGKPLKRRLPGSELFPILWKRMVAENRKVMVVAPSEKVGELLQKELPSLVCYVPPFFDENDPAAVLHVVKEARAVMENHRPEFVFLGIRFPKQNYIALGMMGANIPWSEEVQNRPDTQTSAAQVMQQPPLFLLLGASYEFYLDLKKRAPAFWQKIGMEWFYRFTQEPGRLFKRYFIDDIRFFPIVWRERQKH